MKFCLRGKRIDCPSARLKQQLICSRQQPDRQQPYSNLYKLIMIKIRQGGNSKAASDTSDHVDYLTEYLNLSHHQHLRKEFDSLLESQNIKILILTCNSLNDLPSLPLSLEYLDASHNNLLVVPSVVHELPHLSVLKLNSNRIASIENVPKLKELRIADNPIVTIDSSIYTLGIQIIDFDWMFYVGQHQIQQQTSQFNTLLKAYGFQQKVSLLQFLQMSWCPERLDSLASRMVYAMNKKHYEVFSFLASISYYIDCTSKYKDKLVFEIALTNDHPALRKYFLKCRYNLQSKKDYLHLVCVHGNYTYFRHLVSLGFSINAVDREGNNLYHDILSNFNQQNQLTLKFLLEHNPKYLNRLNFHQISPVLYSAYSNINNTVKLILWLQRNPRYIPYFQFDMICGDIYKENILHLASRFDNYQLIQLIMELRLVNPFVTNSMNKYPTDLTQYQIIKKQLTKYQNEVVGSMEQNYASDSTTSSIQSQCELQQIHQSIIEAGVTEIIQGGLRTITESSIEIQKQIAQSPIDEEETIGLVNSEVMDRMTEASKYLDQTRASSMFQAQAPIPQ